MKYFLTLFLLIFIATACKKETVDVIVTNANIYTVNKNFETAEAFAIKNGKFIAVGKTAEIIGKYEADSIINANKQTIIPGIIDAHCHFYRLGLQQQKVALEGTTSYNDVLKHIVAFQKKNNVSFITGRGWDQNDWPEKEFPTKDKLDQLFPKTPVAVGRVDGHALLVNQAALDLSNIDENTTVSGGEFIKKDGKLTGVLIDAAMDFIKLPKPSKKQAIKGLLDAQKIGFSYGLTTVDDAGLDRQTIELIDSLQKSNLLKMRIYAMVSGDKQDQIDYYINKGIYKTDFLNVRSFKVYGDGALGSRGAAMRKPYSDRENHFGALIYSPERYQDIAKQIAASDFQMNTHAIGDSANTWLLKTYKSVLKNAKNRRWRIEHAQIISKEDFKNFDNILPSVQPTHATSDMYWAEDRVGAERIKGAYAFKDLLSNYGKIALGTDFPVEQVNPFLTFYAATARKDSNNYPKEGYQMENALSREETLKGMTIWGAFSNFEEDEKGSIEAGKFADFVILNQDIMQVELSKTINTKVKETYVGGNRVF